MTVYPELPGDVPEALFELYDDHGVRIWWWTNNVFLGNAPGRMWDTKDGREKVTALVQALVDGAVL